MKLSIITHGTVGFDVPDIAQLISDYGAYHMFQIGQKLKDEKDLVIVYPDVIKHVQSANIILAQLPKGTPHAGGVWPFREKDYTGKDHIHGKHENLFWMDGDKRADIAGMSWYSKWEKDIVEKFGCETTEQVDERVRKGLKWLFEKFDDKHVILITSVGTGTFIDLMSKGGSLKEIMADPKAGVEAEIKHGEIRNISTEGVENLRKAADVPAPASTPKTSCKACHKS